MIFGLHPGPWACREQDLRAELTAGRACLEAARAGTFGRPAFETAPPGPRGVAILRVRGFLQRQPTLLGFMRGGSDYQTIHGALGASKADADVGAIALEIDSPGGDALALAELADAIFEARKVKPVHAVIRGLGTSAAYYIAAAAGRVHVAREAVVGAIGTVLSIVDFRKLDERIGIEEIAVVSSQSPKKMPDPKTDAGRAQLQAEVDAIAQTFIESVARYRGVTVARVLEGFGQGDVFVGQAAVDAGLADDVATLDQVLEQLAAELEGAQRPSSTPPTPAPPEIGPGVFGGAPPQRGPVRSAAPAPDGASPTWASILDVARGVEAADRLARRDFSSFAYSLSEEIDYAHASRYVEALRRLRIGPEQALALVRGDEDLASALRVRTLGQELAREASAREQHLRQLREDDGLAGGLANLPPSEPLTARAVAREAVRRAEEAGAISVPLALFDGERRRT